MPPNIPTPTLAAAPQALPVNDEAIGTKVRTMGAAEPKRREKRRPIASRET